MSVKLPAIGVVQDSNGLDVQRLFRGFVDRWKSTARIVGMIEDGVDASRNPRGARQLVSVADGCKFRVFQDLGTGSTGCQIDPESLMSAGEAVRRHVELGCDLVILSKFAKLEAERRGGLMPALIFAVEAGIPILTSVAPKFDAAWDQFAQGGYIRLSASQSVLEDWWRHVRESPQAH